MTKILYKPAFYNMITLYVIDVKRVNVQIRNNKIFLQDYDMHALAGKTQKYLRSYDKKPIDILGLYTIFRELKTIHKEDIEFIVNDKEEYNLVLNLEKMSDTKFKRYITLLQEI